MRKPTYDRLRNDRIVLIEYIENETFEDFPYTERYTMTLLTQGTIHICYNNASFSLSAPAILCTNSADRLTLEKESTFHAKSISFHPKFINTALDFQALETDLFVEIQEEHDRNMMSYFNHKYGRNGIFSLPANAYLKIDTWWKKITNEIVVQSDMLWTCRIRKFLLQTFYLLDDIYMEQLQHLENTKLSPVDKALDYIHTNYMSCIELSDVCNITGTNRTKLNQEFKDKTGTTVISYLNNYRIEIAKQSLTHTELSLDELAEALGYRYSSYFITQFKKIVGITPGEYREKYRVKRAPHE